MNRMKILKEECDNMGDKWNELNRILRDPSTPVLFLGAGFSLGAKNAEGKELPKGSDLVKELFNEFIVNSSLSDKDKEQCNSLSLRELCNIIDSINGDSQDRNDYLRNRFLGAYSETDYHKKITGYPWKCIYTVNIDDLVENIFEKENKELISYNRKYIVSNDSSQSTELYKLHGCVRNPKEGFVFSEDEYAEITSDNHIDHKLIKFIQALTEQNIIFVGASIDEPDINHYLRLYAGARASNTNNKLFFINPNPDVRTKMKIEGLGGVWINSTAEEFFNYVEGLHYNPTLVQKTLTNLNYHGVFRLQQIEENYKEVYDSDLFEGNHGEWQDVDDNWMVQGDNYFGAINKLNQLMCTNKKVVALSVFGNIFDGKSCLIKQLGYYLHKAGYEVLEFHGRELQPRNVIEYVNLSNHDKYALIVDPGSYYYDRFERLFASDIGEKKLIIISGTRKYYHTRKRYYLEGNDYLEYEMKETFSRNDAECIRNLLDEKARLSFLINIEKEKQIQAIYNQKSYSNLILYLSYGNTVSRVNKIWKNAVHDLSQLERRLLIELVVFDLAEIEIYPMMLFAVRYGRRIALNSSSGNNRDVKVGRIIDFIRIGKDGISLKNIFLDDIIPKEFSIEVRKVLEELLRFISRFVNEKQRDEWYCIFQRLLKVDILKDKFNLSVDAIDNLITSLKDCYEPISYYWLQLGLVKQRKHDYVKAYSYLSKSAKIRPNSYQIQHALARNYLKHANDTNDYLRAASLFEEGEKLMKELIESNEYSKQKAKPFSINCYVIEKIKFAEHSKHHIEDNELKYMIRILGDMMKESDPYMKNATIRVIKYLKEVDKVDLISLKLNSPYLKYLVENDAEDDVISEEDDLFVD